MNTAAIYSCLYPVLEDGEELAAGIQVCIVSGVDDRIKIKTKRKVYCACWKLDVDNTHIADIRRLEDE